MPGKLTGRPTRDSLLSRSLPEQSLRPTEHKLGFRGQLHFPVAKVAGLENEAATPRFIESETNIPIPKALAVYKKDGSFSLWAELIRGVPI